MMALEQLQCLIHMPISQRTFWDLQCISWLDVVLEKRYCWENVSIFEIEDDPRFFFCRICKFFIIYSARVNAFRQGISLLCMFATHDKSFADKRSPVEWNFIQLICCAVKMFRTMPSVGESESKPCLISFLLTLDDY